MSNLVTLNGSNYIIPDVGETGWGSNVTSYLIAIAAGVFQKTGGSFTLTSEADFGPSFGLKALYLRSETANGANAGFIKMAPSDTVSWRNTANNADLQMGVDSSDNLLFNGHIISSSGGVLEFPNGTVTAPGIASVSYPTTGIYIPAANTLGFTTNGILGLSIDATQQLSVTGRVNTFSNSTNGQTQVVITNPNTGTSAFSSVVPFNGTTSSMLAHYGTGNTGTLFGLTLAGYGVLQNNSAGSGLLLNTIGATAITFGTNSTKALTIDSNQQATFVGQVTTAINSNNGSTILVVENDSAGTGAQSKLSVSNGTSSASLQQYGTGNTSSLFGITATNYSLLAASGSGLFINTLAATPIILGTNSTKALTIDSSQNATFQGTIASVLTSNQIILGTTRTVTLSATQPASTSRTVTFPDLSGDYSIVGNGTGLQQTLNTGYTFTVQLKVTPVTNQLVLGTTNTTTISATAPAASRVYTIPDAGGAANFLLSGSGQIVNADINASAAIALSKLATLTTARALQSNSSTGFIEVSAVTNTELGYVSGVTSAIQTQLNGKASTSSPTFSGTITAANAALTDTSNQLVLGTTRTATLTAPTPATSSRVYTFPDLTGDYSVVATIGTQTISGAKTFSTSVTMSSNNASNVNFFEVDNTNNSSATSSAALAATVGGASAGDAYSQYVVIGATTWTTGLDNSDSDKYKISASNTLGTSDALVLSTAGAATLTGVLSILATTNQIVLSTATNTLTISAATQATARTWTIPDISAAGTFAALEGTQTFSGAKTFSSNISMASTNVSGTNLVAVANNDNTSTSSSAAFQATVAGSGAGDPYAVFAITGGTTWAIGADNSVNDNFKISRSSTIGIGDDIIIDATTDGVSIKGTNTNAAPAAGYVGEVISSTVSTPTNDGGNDVWSDLTSISLTAGHWMVSGQMDFILGSGVAITQHNIGISTTSGNSATGLTVGDTRLLTVPATTLTDTSCTLTAIEAKLTGTTIYYLKNKTEETSGNSQMRGRITAVRIS